MDKQIFNSLRRNNMERRRLTITVDRATYMNGWDDCIKELEKVTGLDLDKILIMKGDFL